MASASKTAVMQNNGSTDVAPDWLPKGAARGQENVTQDDIIIPRLEIVQALSPCRKKTDPSYIDGAEEGMLYNNLTRELYGKEVTLMPVFFRKQFLIWKDRKKGGGFRGAHSTVEAAENAIMGLENPDDYEAIDTAEQFCLLVREGNAKPEEIVLSMARTKLKVSRRWNSLIRMTGHDAWAKKYAICVVLEKNAQGQDYYNYDVKPRGFVTKELYAIGQELYEKCRKGLVEADRSTPEEDGHATPENTEY